MKHTRVASYIPPSAYSKNSPSIKPSKTEILKRNVISSESSRQPKLIQQDMNIRAHGIENAFELPEKKFSQLYLERKNDLMTTNIYQLAKGLERDKQTYSKIYQTKDSQKKLVKPPSRQGDKLVEKSPLHPYTQSKTRKNEEIRTGLNSSHQTSRVGSRIMMPDDHGETLMQRISDNNSNVIPKRGVVLLNDAAQMRPKSKTGTLHKKSASISIKEPPKVTPTYGTKQLSIAQPSVNNVSFNEIPEEHNRTPEGRKIESSKISSNNFNDALALKLKSALQSLQGDLQNAKHRRGLSSGQAPVFIEQIHNNNSNLNINNNNVIVNNNISSNNNQQPEKIKPLDIGPQDPHAEQDEYYEKFFHSDKMTFEFEKLILSQRLKAQQQVASAVTPTNHKPGMTHHARTRSIEDPNSVLPTKASSRWNTKRSSVGDDAQGGRKETFNLIEQISDFDKTDSEKEELRRYLRG